MPSSSSAASRTAMGRWRSLLSPGALKSRIGTKLLQLRVPRRWKSSPQGQFQKREYSSYETYVQHQQAKLGRVDLQTYDSQYRNVLRQRLERAGRVRRGSRVVCLAARIGTEVKAFTDLGCFAVGIDLNPGAANAFVLHGDFHHLQFADGVADVVFTNSLDHCFELERVLHEVRRVLAPDGLFVVEAVRGTGEGCQPLFYESFAWTSVDALVSLIEAGRFECLERSAFEYPWAGEHLVFRVLHPDGPRPDAAAAAGGEPR